MEAGQEIEISVEYSQKRSFGQCTISMVTSQLGEHLTTAFA